MAYTRRYHWDNGTIQGWSKHYGDPAVALGVAPVSRDGSAGSLRVDLTAIPASGFVNAAIVDGGQALGGALAGGNLRAVVRQETGGPGWSFRLYWQERGGAYTIHGTTNAGAVEGQWVEHAAPPSTPVPADTALINNFGVEFVHGGPAPASASFSIDFFDQGTADALPPTSTRWYANGAPPTGSSQTDALAALRAQYDWFIGYTLTQAGMPAGMPAGAWRVKVPDQVDPVSGQANGTFSEGIGYGLLIMGWMGDPANPVYDGNARAYLDGLWAYYRHYRNANGLMHWRIDHLGNVTGTGGATDGDQDAAFALLLAHRNWGSAGAVNYLADATALINAIDSKEFTATGIMTNGDQWGLDADRYMPDYFSPAMYRAFGRVVNQARWDAIIAANYPRAQGYFYTNFSTGMTPDECTRAGAPVPGTSYKYGYNSIRMPLRIALDYLWHGAGADPLARDAPLRLANWHRDPARANGDPTKARAEWAIDGSASATYTNSAFVAGYGVAGTVDAATAGWAGACLGYLRDNGRGPSYFSGSLATLALLILAGQAQPYAAPDPTAPGVPTPTALAPASLPAGSGGFTLTVTGSGFAPASVVRWNGADRPTTYVGATELRAAIPASDVASAGTAQVSVV